MRKKTIPKRPPREKIFKLPTKPSTRSQDRTFIPSPSPPTSPPRTASMARTKTTPRYPASAKPTPPPKATPSKPGSSKPSSAKPGSSKGKRQVTEEPIPEPTQPKSRSVPMRSQRGNTRVPLQNVKEPDIGLFDHKAHFLTSHSNYNPYRFKSAMNNDFYEKVIQYRTAHSYVKGRDIVLNNETISDALKYTDIGPCAYTSVKWDEGVGVSYNDALAIADYVEGCITHKPLHPVAVYDQMAFVHNPLHPVADYEYSGDYMLIVTTHDAKCTN
nr:anther-specific proline-rich protein APG-like [Arachis hypogaea]